MKLVIEVNPSTGQINIDGSGVPDRATALDLLEMARQVIHQQGQKERQAKAIEIAPASLLRKLSESH